LAFRRLDLETPSSPSPEFRRNCRSGEVMLRPRSSCVLFEHVQKGLDCMARRGLR
jgi:hypothetical protein